MSIKVMSYVWEHSSAKGSELLLLLAISDHAADDGYCWPTIETLAHKIRMTGRSVMRLVQELEKHGQLHVVRSNKNNRYIVIMDRDGAAIDSVLEMRKEASSDKLSRENLTRDKDVTSIGDTHVTSIGDKDVTLIITEPSIESSNISKDMNDKNGRDWFMALSDICVVDLSVATKAQKDQLGQSAKILKKSGATPEQIASFSEWWKSEDWRGKQGQAPTPAQVRNEWGKFTAVYDNNGRRVVKLGR